MPNTTAPIQDRASPYEDNDSQCNFALGFKKQAILAHVQRTGVDLVVSLPVLP
jgi:hypothetical protein